MNLLVKYAICSSFKRMPFQRRVLKNWYYADFIRCCQQLIAYFIYEIENDDSIEYRKNWQIYPDISWVWHQLYTFLKVRVFIVNWIPLLPWYRNWAYRIMFYSMSQRRYYRSNLNPILASQILSKSANLSNILNLFYYHSNFYYSPAT